MSPTGNGLESVILCTKENLIKAEINSLYYWSIKKGSGLAFTREGSDGPLGVLSCPSKLMKGPMRERENKKKLNVNVFCELKITLFIYLFSVSLHRVVNQF